MRVTGAESTELFVGDPDDPLQVVRVRYTGEPGLVRVEGDGLTSAEPRPVDDGVLEVPVRVDNPALKAMGSFKAETVPVAKVGANMPAVQRMLDRVGFK